MFLKNTTLENLMQGSNGRLLWTVKEVGSVLRVSQSSVNNYINADINPLGSVKLGSGKKSAIRVPVEKLASFIDSLASDREV